MDLNVKDKLYYEDLIYKIKGLAKIKQLKDVERENRIIKRTEDVEVGHYVYELSIFSKELYEIIHSIALKANVPVININEIPNYLEFVNEVLTDLENKKNGIDNPNNEKGKQLSLTK